MARGWVRYLPEQLVLKISLLDTEPEIWRRVEVHSGLTLDDLHIVIQNAFEWENSHMYQFLATPGGKLTQKAMRDATYYHRMPPIPAFADTVRNDRRSDEALVGHVLTSEQKQIVYEYDLGDSWHHLVKVEKRTPGGDENHVPVCLAGENAGPVDDMGGIPGYYMWLDALRDAKNPMHEQALQWLGPDFDPARFDLAEVNWRLSMAFKPAPQKLRKRRRKGD